jgi:DNA-binding LytR/AlgR family response regulator
VDSLVAALGYESGLVMQLRAVVADADPLARLHLVRLLEAESPLEIVCQATNAAELLAASRKTKPDVLFLDARLADTDGDELLRRLPSQPLVVLLTTNHSDTPRALAERALERLVKPIRAEDVAHLVQELRVLAGWALRARPSPPANDQILVAVRDLLKPVRFDQIVYLESRDKCTMVRTPNATYEANLALVEIESRLPRSDFVRIHRRHVVNREYIAGLRRFGNRQLRVELSLCDQPELEVSRRCAPEVLRRLGDAGKHGAPA